MLNTFNNDVHIECEYLSSFEITLLESSLFNVDFRSIRQAALMFRAIDISTKCTTREALDSVLRKLKDLNIKFNVSITNENFSYSLLNCTAPSVFLYPDNSGFKAAHIFFFTDYDNI